MREKIVSMEQAVSLVSDGCLIAFGGVLLKRKPMAFVRGLIRRGVRDLETIAFISSLEVDLLVGAGMVRATHAAYVGFEQLGAAPNFQAQDKARMLDVHEYSEYMLMYGLRAAAMGLPYLPTRAGLGSDVTRLRQLKTIECPYTGDTLIAVPAIRPDLAVIHALRSDPYGNIQMPEVPDLLENTDVVTAKAAKRVIVTVEEVVSPEEFRAHASQTLLFHWEVEAVVHAPRGAYPTSYSPLYPTDLEHCAMYLRQAATPDGFREYLNGFVLTDRFPAATASTTKGTA